MAKIAIIRTGGKQYKVTPGDTLKVEKIKTESGKKHVFKDVLLVSEDSGKDLKLGDPQVKKAQVEATVLEQGRNKKIRVVKYKPKTRYHKVSGHRQPYSLVKIEKINL